MCTANLILIDLDDVLCSTTEAAITWHNKHFGTHLKLADFHYYHWWKNPGWGTPDQTAIKADLFYKSEEYKDVQSIGGAYEVLQRLKLKGFRFAVLTSRDKDLKKLTESWVEKWYPNIFDTIYYSEDFTKTSELTESISSRFNKGEMCKNLQAGLLIDDALENVQHCVGVAVPALVFGDYDWGKRLSLSKAAEDLLSFEEREEYEIKQGHGTEWWLHETVGFPSDGVWYVKNWQQVLEWFEGPGKHIVYIQGVD